MRRSGFTLIECLCAIMLFAIGILVSTLYVAQQLRMQEVTHARTIAGAAAMLLADWHVARHTADPVAYPDFESSCVGANRPLAGPSLPLANLSWRGGDQPSDDAYYLFNDTCTDPATAAVLPLCRIDAASVRPGHSPVGTILPGYRRLVVGLSPPSADEADSGLRFRQFSLWAGNRDELLAGRPATLEFLGRFACAER